MNIEKQLFEPDCFLTEQEKNHYNELLLAYSLASDDVTCEMLNAAIATYVNVASERYSKHIKIYRCDSCNKQFIADHNTIAYYGDTDDLYCNNCLSTIEAQAICRCN